MGAKFLVSKDQGPKCGMDNWILIVHRKTDKDVTEMGAKFLVSKDQGPKRLEWIIGY